MTENSQECRILLLDDDEDDYMLVKAMIRGTFSDRVIINWFQQDHFSNTMICSGFYRVTLVDYRLGMEDGLEVIRKAKAECPDQKIVLFSGWTDPSIEEKAKQIGADGYLSKSDLSEELLKNMISQWLDCVETD